MWKNPKIGMWMEKENTREKCEEGMSLLSVTGYKPVDVFSIGFTPPKH